MKSIQQSIFLHVNLLFVYGVVCIGIFIPLISGYISLTSNIYKTIFKVPNAFIFLSIVFLSIALLLYSCSKQCSKKKYYKILLFLILISFSLRFMYLFHYDQTLYTDFKTMWDFSLYIYDINSFVPPIRPQQERTIPFLLPLVIIFGKSIWVYKIANVVSILLISILVSYLLSKWLSYRASLLAFLIITLTPQTYYASIIPTHDIPAALFTIILLFIVFKIIENKEKNKILLFMYVMALVFFALLLHIQRGTDTLFFLSIVFLIPLFYFLRKDSRKTLMLKIFLIFIIPILFLSAVISTLEKKNFLLNETNTLKIYQGYWFFVHNNTFSNGTFSAGNIFYNNYALPLSTEDFDYYTKAITLSDLYYNILDRPVNYYSRAARLYDFSKGEGIYYGKLFNVTNKQKVKIVQRNKAVSKIYLLFYMPILFFSSIILLVSTYLWDKNTPYILFPLLFTGILSFALLLFGENQARYLFIGWFVWPIVIAAGMEYLLKWKNIRKRSHAS